MIYQDIIKAAHLGGEFIKKYFFQSLEIQEKSIAADFRTQADLESEQAILEYLQKIYPLANYICEETDSIDNNSEHTFIIDPLDGTNSFNLGIAHFSVSIALLKKSVPMFGVVYNPISSTTIHAHHSHGTFLNNQKAQVSSTMTLGKSTIGYSCGYINDRSFFYRLQTNLEQRNIKRLLVNWSPAMDLALLAAGKIDAIIYNGCEIYDHAAGKILVQEAGGKVTDFQGQIDTDIYNPFFVASNGTTIHDEIIEILQTSIMHHT